MTYIASVFVRTDHLLDIPKHSRFTAQRLHFMRLKERDKKMAAAKAGMQAIWNKAKTK